MKEHLDFAYCSKKEPLIYRHRMKRNYKRIAPYFETSDKKVYHDLCNVKQSHFPLIFIDECSDKLPREDLLSKFLVVLTSTKVRIFIKS